jgi:hypothetical protein
MKDHPVAAKTVNTVTSGDEAALKLALTAYDALSAAVKEKLLPLDRAALEALGSKIAELKIIEANQAAAAVFETDHATALTLTTATVTTANTAIVGAALAAYENLAQPIKDLLTAKKTLLDSLKTEIDRQQANEDQAEYNAFNTDHGTTLAIEVDNLTLGDTDAVEAAYAAWNSLSAGARARAPAGTAAKVNALKAKVDELKAPGAAAAFQAAHGAFLATAPAALDLTAHTASLTAARTDYNALTTAAKAQLDTDYPLLYTQLQTLEARMAVLREVDSFTTTYNVALGLTTSTVTVSHEAAVDIALDAWERLSGDAKTEAAMTAAKTLLDDLKEAILSQKKGSVSITITLGQMEDENFTLADITLIRNSPAATRIAVFALGSGLYTNIRWAVDAADLDWADGEEFFAFDAANWAVGKHVLGVTVEKNNRTWSKNIVVTVTNSTGASQ